MDPKGIKDVRELIRRFQKQGVTVFLSSHLLAEVSKTCDTVIFLDNGKVVTTNSIENIMNKTELKIIEAKFLKPLSRKDITHIGSITGIESLERINEHLRIHFDGDPTTSFQILSNLVSSGYQVVSFAPQTMGLEDYYVSIVGDERGVS